ncbi:hypothetical protein Esti_006855 [Eimeria stiedai]
MGAPAKEGVTEGGGPGEEGAHTHPAAASAAAAAAACLASRERQRAASSSSKAFRGETRKKSLLRLLAMSSPLLRFAATAAAASPACSWALPAWLLLPRVTEAVASHQQQQHQDQQQDQQDQQHQQQLVEASNSSTSSSSSNGSTDGRSLSSESSSSFKKASRPGRTEGVPLGGLSLVEEEKRIEAVIAQDTPKVDWRVVQGWTLPENNMYRNYICRLGGAGTPCWDEIGLWNNEVYKNWPMPIYCPTSHCCGDHSGGGVRCNDYCGGGSWSAMHGDQCSCHKLGFKCPKNTECNDSERGVYGGAWCQCKEGYVGDGFTCYADPCASRALNKCAPGKCVGRPNGAAYCRCPKGYTWDGRDPYSPKCVFEDMCASNPCGPEEAVLQCRTDKALEYSCVCRPGFEVGTVDGAKKCVVTNSRSKCSDEPCGTQGLLSCTDTPTGAHCVCQKGHRLVTEKRAKSCIYSPCDSEPCGNATAVKSCIAGISSYTCTCNPGHYLDTQDGLPVCVRDNDNYLVLLFAGGAAGVGLLITLLSCFVLRRRLRARNAFEAYAEGGLSDLLGAQQNGGLGTDASYWM